ncbi:hypothetical protein ACWEPA_10995 [Streptomyces filamentosus]
MLPNRRTRVLRTAAVATGTSVALLLPAAAAFADGASAGPGAAVRDQVSGRPPADGSTARVRQTGEGSHRLNAQIKLPDGNVATFAGNVRNGPRVQVSRTNDRRIATVDAEHLAARHRGWTYELAVQPGKHQYRFVVVDTPKQGGNSWVYDLNGRLVAKYHAQKR